MNGIRLEQFWWERDGLRYEHGRLFLSGKLLSKVIQAADTPCFVYSGDMILENLRRLHAGLDKEGLDHRIFFAVKSNRFAPVLATLRQSGLCSIDTGSPAEVLLARSHGISEREISFMGRSLSTGDIEEIA